MPVGHRTQTAAKLAKDITHNYRQKTVRSEQTDFLIYSYTQNMDIRLKCIVQFIAVIYIQLIRLTVKLMTLKLLMLLGMTLMYV